jgi:hypothetical protein
MVRHRYPTNLLGRRRVQGHPGDRTSHCDSRRRARACRGFPLRANREAGTPWRTPTSSAILGCDAPNACVPGRGSRADRHPRAHCFRDIRCVPADSERWSWSFPAERPFGTASRENRRRPCPRRTCSPGHGLRRRGWSPRRSLAGGPERLQLSGPWQRADGSHRAVSLPGAGAHVLQRPAAHSHRRPPPRVRGARVALRRASWREVWTRTARPYPSALAGCAVCEGLRRHR